MPLESQILRLMNCREPADLYEIGEHAFQHTREGWQAGERVMVAGIASAISELVMLNMLPSRL